jgi:Zn-dependent protease with chaperone function
MTIDIAYDKAKTQQALCFHFISKMDVKVLLILVNVFAVFSAGLFALKMIRPTPFLLTSLLWLVLMLVFWFLLPRMVYRRSATFKENIRLSFRTDDLMLETSRGYTNWAYKKFLYYLETPHFFHLYINDRSFFLIPKACCTGEADTVVVRALLNDKVGRK